MDPKGMIADLYITHSQQPAASSTATIQPGRHSKNNQQPSFRVAIPSYPYPPPTSWPSTNNPPSAARVATPSHPIPPMLPRPAPEANKNSRFTSQLVSCAKKIGALLNFLPREIRHYRAPATYTPVAPHRPVSP